MITKCCNNVISKFENMTNVSPLKKIERIQETLINCVDLHGVSACFKNQYFVNCLLKNNFCLLKSVNKNRLHLSEIFIKTILENNKEVIEGITSSVGTACLKTTDSKKRNLGHFISEPLVVDAVKQSNNVDMTEDQKMECLHNIHKIFVKHPILKAEKDHKGNTVAHNLASQGEKWVVDIYKGSRTYHKIKNNNGLTVDDLYKNYLIKNETSKASK